MSYNNLYLAMNIGKLSGAKGVVHILRNQQRGRRGFPNDYGGGGVGR